MRKKNQSPGSLSPQRRRNRNRHLHRRSLLLQHRHREQTFLQQQSLPEDSEPNQS